MMNVLERFFLEDGTMRARFEHGWVTVSEVVVHPRVVHLRPVFQAHMNEHSLVVDDVTKSRAEANRRR